ncbi:uroporphyrin-III C-methyltransferase [Ascobolus immersus RN42]|uniref:Uroporphyrin-III C-methyltransferase n=1 Tax=Ascobolus immersus RN42 TaxID=1160509 RepID=A0A3N4IBL0_ASCIM|nr:uroporphyrin-III C-methyltransferase [Ascobolus immersus RN42]
MTVSQTPPPLLSASSLHGHHVLLLGLSSLTASRCAQLLAYGANVQYIADRDLSQLPISLKDRIEAGEVTFHDRAFDPSDLTTLGREETDRIVDRVFVTAEGSEKDTIVSQLTQPCTRLRIPYNISDTPPVSSTFTILATHSSGPLHIGITTSGQGCKLAARIRKEIISFLPSNLGEACARLGQLRRQLQAEDKLYETRVGLDTEEDTEQPSTFNNLVRESDTSPETLKTRRIRWLSQICEYYPLSHLCSLTPDDLEALLTTTPAPEGALTAPEAPLPPSIPKSKKGSITLLGSGPGHASLLTLAAHTALQTADLILADKLVPESVLSTLPRRTPLHIARKFPGNAERAQEELMELALAALSEGKNVLRLKQGDPFLFGRGGEEVIRFRKAGYPTKVVPGITSALSGPMFAGIPVTHRSVADGVLIVTGTGRKGVPPPPPEYVPNRTVVFLMGLHRLEDLTAELVGNGFPAEVECAVVERASCGDQRVVRTTLSRVVEAVKVVGSRPPGILVVGRACEVLREGGLGKEGWVVEEGMGEGW